MESRYDIITPNDFQIKETNFYSLVTIPMLEIIIYNYNQSSKTSYTLLLIYNFSWNLLECATSKLGSKKEREEAVPPVLFKTTHKDLTSRSHFINALVPPKNIA